MTAPRTRIPVAILGATGAVGQTFVRRLVNHPWFEISELAASDRSAGKPYAEACRWLEGEMPVHLADRRVVRCEVGAISSPIVFSALDAAVAGEMEPAFARATSLPYVIDRFVAACTTFPLLPATSETGTPHSAAAACSSIMRAVAPALRNVMYEPLRMLVEPSVF